MWKSLVLFAAANGTEHTPPDEQCATGRKESSKGQCQCPWAFDMTDTLKFLPLCVFETMIVYFQKLELKLLASAVERFQRSRVTVLPWSGEVVVWGWEILKTFYAIHLFVLVGFREEKKLQKRREVLASCQHDVAHLCPLVVGQRKVLGVTCYHCHDIKLIDMSNGDESVAFQGGCLENDFRPAFLCYGEPGKLWLLQLEIVDKDTNLRKYCVIELDCSSSTFTPTGRGFPLEIKGCNAVFHCLPSPHNALVLCQWKAPVVSSFSCESGDKLWELKGEVDGADIDPQGVTFSPQHQLLLMADYTNKHILALDPRSGSHLQSLPVPQEVGDPVGLCLHNELLFMTCSLWCEDGWSDVLSCFSLT